METPIEFWAGNPSVELWHGSILTSNLNPKAIYKSYICITSLPTEIQILELCEFLEPHEHLIAHARVLRSPDKHTYIVVIKLKSDHDFKQFTEIYHGKFLNPIETTTCDLHQLIGAKLDCSNCESHKKKRAHSEEKGEGSMR